MLVTVADAEGLSYYSDTTLERMLNMEHGRFLNARHQLCQAGLLAYDKPLYQILSLELPLDAQRRGRTRRLVPANLRPWPISCAEWWEVPRDQLSDLLPDLFSPQRRKAHRWPDCAQTPTG